LNKILSFFNSVLKFSGILKQLDDILDGEHVEIDEHTGDSGYKGFISGILDLSIDFIVHEFSEVGSLLFVGECVESIHVIFNALHIFVDDGGCILLGDGGGVSGGGMADVMSSRSWVHVTRFVASV
jgi:hypothetical protein